MKYNVLVDAVYEDVSDEKASPPPALSMPIDRLTIAADNPGKPPQE